MRSLVKAGLLAAAFVLLCTGSARASTIEVKVPFAFLVHGRTLPAGQYLLSDENGVVLLRGERGIYENVLIVATPASGRDPAGNQPALLFAHKDNAYRLTGIWETSARGLQVR